MASSTLKVDSYGANRACIEKGQVREEFALFCQSMKDLFVSSFSKGCICEDYFQVDEEAYYHFMSGSKVSFEHLIGVIETVNKDNYPHFYKALADAVLDVNDDSYSILETVLSLTQFDTDLVEDCFKEIINNLKEHTSNDIIYCLVAGGVEQVLIKNIDLDIATYNVAIAHLEDKTIVDQSIPDLKTRKFKSAKQYFKSYLKHKQDVYYDYEDSKVALSVYFGVILILVGFLASQWDIIYSPFTY